MTSRARAERDRLAAELVAARAEDEANPTDATYARAWELVAALADAEDQASTYSQRTFDVSGQASLFSDDERDELARIADQATDADRDALAKIVRTVRRGR
ncbi:MAG: hypothetical protein JWN10_1458 [Solirubrobacterales bacterium]|nr:hypothetical protein [Solirubrobacterales bacterium]